jgi:hypothetical protein
MKMKSRDIGASYIYIGRRKVNKSSINGDAAPPALVPGSGEEVPATLPSDKPQK